MVEKVDPNGIFLRQRATTRQCGGGMVGTHSALVLNVLNQANKSVPHLI